MGDLLSICGGPALGFREKAMGPNKQGCERAILVIPNDTDSR